VIEAPDFGAPLRRLAATAVDAVRTRIELGATELAEERLRLAQQGFALLLALQALGVGLVLGVLGLAWWAGPQHGVAVLGAGAALALAGALAALLRWRRIQRSRPPLLHETLAQLQADARALAPEQAP
jgi:uncharacterized membrane protein YqjE